MDLAGVCLTADAAHTTKANCRQLTQGNGADFFLFLTRLSLLAGKNREFQVARLRKCLMINDPAPERLLATDLPSMFLPSDGIRFRLQHVPQMSYTVQRRQGA
jgi:hypothetical protein